MKYVMASLFILSACSTQKAEQPVSCERQTEVYQYLCGRKLQFVEKYNTTTDDYNKQRYSDSIQSVNNRLSISTTRLDSLGCTIPFCD